MRANYNSGSKKTAFVNIGAIAIGNYRDVLKISSLGSCIGLVIYPLVQDSSKRVAVMSHIMLPAIKNNKLKRKRRKRRRKFNMSRTQLKYADIAIPEMIRILEKEGFYGNRLVAKMAGGAKIIDNRKLDLKIGKENVKSVQQLLHDYDIPIKGSYVGGTKSMTVSFQVRKYKMIIDLNGEPSIII